MINVYARPTALRDVRGRIGYVSNDKKQEYLVATYSTTDRQFWNDLAAHCQKQASEAGHKDACEAREWHAALPNAYAEMYKGREEELAKEISELFEEITETKNFVGLHWNKSHTNFHVHVICSENKEINKITYGAVLTRNTYYDADGKRSAKQDCLDEDGNLKKGCHFYKKGERVVKIQRFGTKENLRHWKVNQKIKKALATKFNADLQENRYAVFKDDGIHLATQHVGNNKTEKIEEAIRAKNALIRDYNKQADEILNEASKDGNSAFFEAMKQLAEWRKEIKEYKLTDMWLVLIRERIQKIKNKIKEGFQTHQEAQEERKPSLADRLANASQRASQNGKRGRSEELKR